MLHPQVPMWRFQAFELLRIEKQEEYSVVILLILLLIIIAGLIY